MDEFLAGAMPVLMAIASIVLMLAKAAQVIVYAIAPLTKNTRDDEIVAWLDQNKIRIKDITSKVEAWADPKNPDVPTGPS